MTIVLLALYHLLRLAAQSCTGAVCDNYIAPSLILPVAVLGMVAITGALAIVAARSHGGPWVILLAAATVAGTAGPIAVAAAFKDMPDTVVPLASVLFLLTPVAALAYSFRASPTPIR